MILYNLIHDFFFSLATKTTLRSSTVCSRSACTLQIGCSCSPSVSPSCRKYIDSLQCQARSDCTSSSRRMKSPCFPLCFIYIYSDGDFRRLFVIPLHFGEGFATKFDEIEANVREPFTLMLSGLRKI